MSIPYLRPFVNFRRSVDSRPKTWYTGSSIRVRRAPRCVRRAFCCRGNGRGRIQRDLKQEKYEITGGKGKKDRGCQCCFGRSRSCFGRRIAVCRWRISARVCQRTLCRGRDSVFSICGVVFCSDPGQEVFKPVPHYGRNRARLAAVRSSVPRGAVCDHARQGCKKGIGLRGMLLYHLYGYGAGDHLPERSAARGNA